MNRNNKGTCFWITGLSGSGKTTISKKLAEIIHEEHQNVILLDGDELRKVLNKDSFNREQRLEIGLTYSRLAKLITSQGTHVVMAVMGLFHELHEWNRKNISNYLEVFLDVPINELERRDPKGLYRKFNSGQIKNMTGLDQKAEFPKNPDIKINWDENQSTNKIAKQIFDFYKK